MKAILKTGREQGLELKDIPIPRPDKKSVLVKIKAAAICGSDLRIYRWDPSLVRSIKTMPVVPGHECSGEVIEIGEEVEHIKVGDKVAAETHISCGKCWQCLHGRPHTCENVVLYGYGINGCFAEYSVIPEVATRKIPEKIPFEQGCLLEPMGIPFRAVERADVSGDVVVVLGCGPIGQFAIAFSRVMGAEIIMAVDTNEKRLNIAHRMGADYLIDPKKETPAERVRQIAEKHGGGAGAVIEASGSISALKEAFQYLRVGGKILVVGQSYELLNLTPSPDIVLKETEVVGFWGRRIWDTWEKTEKILASGQLDVNPVITHRFPLSGFQEAFNTLLEGEGCKVLFIPGMD